MNFMFILLCVQQNSVPPSDGAHAVISAMDWLCCCRGRGDMSVDPEVERAVSP